MSQPIPKDWMNEIDRFGIVYKQGVSDFIQFASDKDPTSTTCPCPCNKCRNRKRFPFDIVRKHLILHGIESTYRVWVLHGENPYKDRMVDQDVEENDKAEGLRMGNLVDVAYGMHEGLAGDLNGGDESEGGDLEPPYVLEPDLGYLIMSSGQSQHTASQPSSSVPLPSHNLTSDSHTSQPSEPTITKLPIEFNGDGVAVGPNHAKWNTQVGVYVRARIPIHYKDWRKVDGSFKDNVWNKLMDKEDPSRKHGREQVDASSKRRKEASAGSEGSVMEVDFDNDELSEVFGPDKGSRTRGISSNKSKKQLQRTGIAKALLQQASSSSNSELKGEMNEMKSSLSNVIGVLKSLSNNVKDTVPSLVKTRCHLHSSCFNRVNVYTVFDLESSWKFCCPSCALPCSSSWVGGLWVLWEAAVNGEAIAFPVPVVFENGPHWFVRLNESWPMNPADGQGADELEPFDSGAAVSKAKKGSWQLGHRRLQLRRFCGSCVTVNQSPKKKSVLYIDFVARVLQSISHSKFLWQSTRRFIINMMMGMETRSTTPVFLYQNLPGIKLEARLRGRGQVTKLNLLYRYQKALLYIYSPVFVNSNVSSQDCIGSAFNVKGVMQCPNCRKVEKGQWLFSNGTRSCPELSLEDWAHDEDLYDPSYSEIVLNPGMWYSYFANWAKVIFSSILSPQTTHELKEEMNEMKSSLANVMGVLKVLPAFFATNSVTRFC
ncbi:hypothetical protein IFM89_036681 [Coptis chinensis]|uniref:Transposase-associated domain-containing protein n=1 Tax=Coptis chinensis TaxID=261450 RepID=A0A835I8F8_9MAGN|nr:hypothetical protein IFM89_036681 [Coptis chinensis]